MLVRTLLRFTTRQAQPSELVVLSTNTLAGAAFAVQPYHTVSGPGLSVAFEQDARDTLQSRPFSLSPAVPSMYHHTLLDHLAEFSVTPRTSRRGKDSQLAAPHPQFWNSVGNINTIYWTLHRPGVQLHPSTGSVELTSSARTSLLDVRSSLFDSAAQPVSSMIMTGSEKTVTSGQLVSSADAAREELSMSRQPLDEIHDQESLQWSSFEANDNVLSWCRISMPKFVKNGEGVASLVRVDAELPAESPELPIAPWAALQLVSRFCELVLTSLLSTRLGSIEKNPIEVGGPCRLWQLVAYHYTHNGDMKLRRGAEIEIVCGEPKFFPSYSIPPWRHRIGLPLLNGMPCCVFHVEARQDSKVAVKGVYYMAYL